MKRLIPLMSLGLLAGCEELAMADLSRVDARTANPGFPAEEAACVAAVRSETRSVDVRVQNSEREGELVRVRLVYGPDAQPWTCLSDAAGNTSDVAPVGVAPLQGPASPEPDARSEISRPVPLEQTEPVPLNDEITQPPGEIQTAPLGDEAFADAPE
ncbi:hypothetical protein [Histidinibacterium aquaticum]|uniref:Lipoprotein n=1 Tax=Histidinibacterium aquaticum TaxID=2613962 RepID=A0A5J5GD75_9RHOB|nr:hypothetical protein [Histidinibacterium aquaticum]KAA9006149.1 hypothetical protein F3S47_16530 [Histidinibacterium aquaticum]